MQGVKFLLIQDDPKLHLWEPDVKGVDIFRNNNYLQINVQDFRGLVLGGVLVLTSIGILLLFHFFQLVHEVL